MRKERFRRGNPLPYLCNYYMNVELIEREVKQRQEYVDRLSYSLETLKKDDPEKHKEAIYLLGQEVFFRLDQLNNYKSLLVNLAEDVPNEELPKEK